MDRVRSYLAGELEAEDLETEE